jgi:hypothetical protein
MDPMPKLGVSGLSNIFSLIEFCDRYSEQLNSYKNTIPCENSAVRKHAAKLNGHDRARDHVCYQGWYRVQVEPVQQLSTNGNGFIQVRYSIPVFGEKLTKLL